MARQRVLIHLLRMEWATLSFAVGLLGLPLLVQGSELSLTIQPGIQQLRNHDRDESWTRQWVRGLPPENSAHLLVVQGPDEWLSDEPEPTRAADLGRLNADHAEVLRAAMAAQDLLTEDQPLLLAGRVIALLRPVEVDGTTAAARRSRIWPLWEVLAYSAHADTLSVTVAAVQALEPLATGARVSLYPTADGRYCFGVLMPAPLGESPAGSWVHPVGRDLLFPVALSARPVSDLRPDDIVDWSWEEVLAPDWRPDATQRGNSADKIAVPDLSQGRRDLLPDLCRQAEALDLECVSGDPEAGREITLLVLSSLTVFALIGWLATSLYRRRLRLLRVWSERDLRRRNRF